MPDLDGVKLAADLRSLTASPIIVLSVRDAERDKIAALDNGANDYVTKPFGMGELLARIRVALRPTAQPPQPPSTPIRITIGDLTLDTDRHEVVVSGVVVHLSPTEFNLLQVLMLNAGKLLTHRTLLHRVWGPEYVADTQLLRVYIGQLRAKIEVRPERPLFVITEPGIGYRLNDVT